VIVKIGLLLQFACAVIGGAFWRVLRRLARRSPRIWHGHWPVHMTREMVRADRLAGFRSRSVAQELQVLSYALMSPADFDVVISDTGAPKQTRHWRAMIDLHLHGDIWVAYFDCLFFPAAHPRRNDLAMRLIRLAGIRTVVAPHGSDILQIQPLPTRYDWIGRMQRDYPDWNFAEQTKISSIRIKHFDRMASMVIAADPATARLMGRVDLVFKYFPVDTSVASATLRPPASIPRIVHAPNHRHVKGTEFLLRAIDDVRARGFACELQLVEGVPRAEALRMYRDADIIGDQFCIGAFGVFALEALALAKPVLTYLDEEHLATPALNLPIVNATPENLTAVLAVLIDIPELRIRLGEAGRAAVDRYQSIDALAEVWSRIYRHIWWKQPLELGKTRHFEPARGPRPMTEDPLQAEFWPVDVSDLMPRIGAAVRKLRGE
jgi:glycosyltransferase involved in cell wall biosynthesis